MEGKFVLIDTGSTNPSPLSWHDQIAYDGLMEACKEVRKRIIWNINTTSQGGGVSELLWSLLPYAKGMDIDVKWLVFLGSKDLFRISKRIYHGIYSHDGDGSNLDESDKAAYEKQFRDAEIELLSFVACDDIVILHDPQVAGFAPILKSRGVKVIWRCHLGSDHSNRNTELAWSFLRPYIETATRLVFLRREFIPVFIGVDKASVVEPSIDFLSHKNRHLPEHEIDDVLSRAGILHPSATVISGVEIKNRCRLFGLGGGLRRGRRLVVQVSRWDWLKDPPGTIRDFARFAERYENDYDFLFVGPETQSVNDDPEDCEVFMETVNAWRELRDGTKDRVGIAVLSMHDRRENALTVNALQRKANVVVQNSVAEGFGLSITEAMWKKKAVIATKIGGIQNQIQNGVSGVLIERGVGLDDALLDLTKDEELQRRYGDMAHAVVSSRYLVVHHLLRFANVINSI
jgi:trehalose synthase